MGRAIIVSGGPDGRYTITTDFGSTTRAAVLAGLQTNLDRLQIQLGQAIAAKNEADAKAAEQRAQLAILANSHASSVTSGGGATGGDNSIATALEVLRKDWVLSSMQAGGARRKVDAIRLDIAYVQQQIGRWNALQTTETRQAWCVDYTTNRAAGSTVATLDINGEGALTVIAPGARAPTAADGQLRARQVQSPAQLFVNMAWLPAWQKWKPKFRWGTITALDEDTNRANVSLAAATSSAQNLDINQATALSNVPVVYMTCHAKAFQVGDRVVVEFLNGNWQTPRVVGFLDNPRRCKLDAIYRTANHPVLGASIISEQEVEIGGSPTRVYAPASPMPWVPFKWSQPKVDGEIVYTETHALWRDDVHLPDDLDVSLTYRELPIVTLSIEIVGDQWELRMAVPSGFGSDGLYFRVIQPCFIAQAANSGFVSNGVPSLGDFSYFYYEIRLQDVGWPQWYHVKCNAAGQPLALGVHYVNTGQFTQAWPIP